MNPPSKDIADFLVAEAPLGLAFITNLFFARMNDKVDNCVAVLDNPGDPPMLTYDKATSDYYYSSVCVQVRDADYTTGYTRMFNIMKFLHGLHQLPSVDDSAYYGVVKAMNEPQVLYWDEKERVYFFVNFDIQRKPI